MQNLIKNFVNDESGATAIEYGLIAALIAVAMIAGATQLGQSIDDKFKDVAVTLNAADDTAGTVTNGAD
ncbi:MAG: Flp family type IVb pilin [Litorimonas sp.]